MRITEVTYEANKNLGNYETERIRLTAVVNENEDAMEVLDNLQDKSLKWLGLDTTPDPEIVRSPSVN